MGRGENPRPYAASRFTVNLTNAAGFARIENPRHDNSCARPLPTPPDASVRQGHSPRVAASRRGDIVWVHRQAVAAFTQAFKRAHTVRRLATPQAIASIAVSPKPFPACG